MATHSSSSVKTRRRDDTTQPSEAINAAKRKLISRGARQVALLDNPDILSRFDVVEIVLAENRKPRFELIRDAFEVSRRMLLGRLGTLDSQSRQLLAHS
jgi:Holliday junction resolvase-like predicted endonuclease